MARPKKVVEPVAEATETVEAVEPVAVKAPAADWLQSLATILGAQLDRESETAATFRKGEIAACINPKAHTAESAHKVLRQQGL